LKIPHPRAFVKFTWKTEVSRQESVGTRQPPAASRHPVKEIARDAVRAEIDTRLATEVLGFPPEVMAPDGPLALPQQKLALEPFITGSKSVSSTGEIKRHPEVERPLVTRDVHTEVLKKVLTWLTEGPTWPPEPCP
jgi:hypothetical protein